MTPLHHEITIKLSAEKKAGQQFTWICGALLKPHLSHEQGDPHLVYPTAKTAAAETTPRAQVEGGGCFRPV